MALSKGREPHLPLAPLLEQDGISAPASSALASPLLLRRLPFAQILHVKAARLAAARRRSRFRQNRHAIRAPIPDVDAVRQGASSRLEAASGSTWKVCSSARSARSSCEARSGSPEWHPLAEQKPDARPRPLRLPVVDVAVVADQPIGLGDLAALRAPADGAPLELGHVRLGQEAQEEAGAPFSRPAQRVR